ncbi:MAG: bifunctional [glutamate--ammonia ligase]-adenylyl-L-tyrosine phosphorylase/[glutamate--ammonia-ligase] adenylyltransferase [Spongiibacteraceae bacterium]|jgi:glutamate-ammonia-ligase adenylyltransferase|nr:bifunctional [glutamate--ammonia ligase]-adenylyl-L-tyrosine phosphorylase/[glutamate--ammonia-ligase] adenylyltransferase [Spongiibacteraceae bacterium]
MSSTPLTPAALADLPPALADEAQRHWACIQDKAGAELQAPLAALTGLPALARSLACSQFFAEQCRRYPAWLVALAADPHPPMDHAALRARLGAPDADEAGFCRQLRQFRNREMLGIVWRDLNRQADLAQTTAALSALAECCIQVVLDWYYPLLCADLGTPRGQDGRPLAPVVLGMGKLGARELNLSSDIDLILAFAESGQTEQGTEHQEFFIRLGQRLMKALDVVTPDGFVFRVDLRLRPWGDSGPLALSFAAIEAYYQDHGRDWERYAMIKARPVAGDIAAGETLLADLRPFVYRRYIDFSAIESLREMKAMIQREVKRRRLQNNIKLGAGGIREVEFIAQAFQLIRGGRDLQLQERALVPVLRALGELNCLPAEVVPPLLDAYRFLRDSEHAIQAWQDQQTQELPQADLPRLALAAAMGYADWPTYLAALDRHRDVVSAEFSEVIAPPGDAPEARPEDQYWRGIWRGDDPVEVVAQRFAGAGHEDAQEAARQLCELRDSDRIHHLQAAGRARLDRFMPLLLAAVCRDPRPTRTLLRILPLVDAVVRRSAYLLLLEENPSALTQLVTLCGASPWIAEQLARHPVLLDELLDVRGLYQVPDKQTLVSELREQTLRVPLDDLEAQMDGLRYFKLSHQLKVAAAEVGGSLPLMKISDYLTWLAEALLGHVLTVAWEALVDKHGRPRRADGALCDPDFIVVGYGKLGGIELSHGSDLDLVFIHDGADDQPTDGARPVETSVFFTRLGQRIIHLLTTHTPLGVLYDVDMRLRPDGAKGLLVSSIKAFGEYQARHAWTWEHQALVRARPVAGDAELGRRFAALRESVLAQPREPGPLQAAVRDMRRRMREHLLPRGYGTPEKPLFHLKHGFGGIVDLEFMVQYAVLAWSHKYPALAVWTDNIRILEALAQAGLLSPERSAALIEAYKVMRAQGHRLNLQQLPGEVPLSEFVAERETVIAAWRELLGDDTPQDADSQQGADSKQKP